MKETQPTASTEEKQIHIKGDPEVPLGARPWFDAALITIHALSRFLHGATVTRTFYL